jgi:hypothetical protein
MHSLAGSISLLSKNLQELGEPSFWGVVGLEERVPPAPLPEKPIVFDAVWLQLAH